MNMLSFKTSVKSKQDINSIAPVFNLLFGSNWLFAFEDKILKVFSSVPCQDMIRSLLKEKGISAEELKYAI
ncbi:hypothetical protein [Pedobacter sp. MC2016-24]|uniref:hypothetical protein n=1 Tax=Pedobacter sp. MC2016-24 TaxID=2780090 RepID=UPI00188201D3|nr:hypothetical protein [Pedobacter sp. MC2016-24]MBE9601102.1 hypothetical protein [Pedobacter sp. MC2016-24]